MFTFQWPYLVLLLPIPFLVKYLWPRAEERKIVTAPEVRFPHLEGLRSSYQSSGSTESGHSRFWSALLFVTWALLVIALMRPQIIDKISEEKNQGHDLMLAVDLSASMQSLDFSEGNRRISRIDVAKKTVQDFVKKRTGDRVGLVLFGEHAYLQSPLSRDTAAVSKMLDNSLPGMAGDATAIGDAIGLAVKNLRDKPGASKAIILLTDGEDNSSTIPPLQAAQLAAQYGIHIYTIVIGKEGIVPIPDDQGHIVMAENHVDTNLTRKIAEMTGGEFYRSTDEKSLTTIYDHIDRLEKTESEPLHILIRRPLYQYPVGLALLLIAAVAIRAQTRRELYGV